MACPRARADCGMRASYEPSRSNGRVQGEPEIHLKAPITAKRQRARKNFVAEIAGAVSSCHAFIEQAPPGECWELAFVAAGPESGGGQFPAPSAPGQPSARLGTARAVPTPTSFGLSRDRC